MTDATTPQPFSPDPDVTDLSGTDTDLGFGDATGQPNDDTTAAGAEAGAQTSDKPAPDDPNGTALEGADPTIRGDQTAPEDLAAGSS